MKVVINRQAICQHSIYQINVFQHLHNMPIIECTLTCGCVKQLPSISKLLFTISVISVALRTPFALQYVTVSAHVQKHGYIIHRLLCDVFKLS